MIQVFNLFGNIACFFGQLNLHPYPWLIIGVFKNLSFASLKIPFESILGSNWLVLGSGSPAPDNASCTSSLFKPGMVAGFVVSPHDGDSVVTFPNPLALESEAKNLSSDSYDDDLSDGGGDDIILVILTAISYTHERHP